MANYGLRGGEIPDINLINTMVDVINFHKRANVVLNTYSLASYYSGSAINDFSFYQQRGYLTLISVWLTSSATPPSSIERPTICSSVDRTNSSVTYTLGTPGTDTVEIEIVDRFGNPQTYYLHFLKTLYSTAHVGDIWISFDPRDPTTKDFKCDMIQFMAVQHEATVTEIARIEEGVQSDYLWWNTVQSFLNSTDKISYSAGCFDSANDGIGRSDLFRELNNEYDLRSGVFDAYLKAAPAGLTEALMYTGKPPITDRNARTLHFPSPSSYSKGVNFTINDSRERVSAIMGGQIDGGYFKMYGIDVLDFAGRDPESRYALQHFNFMTRRFLTNIRVSGSALSAHDLYSMKSCISRFLSVCFDGKSTWSRYSNTSLYAETTTDYRVFARIGIEENPAHKFTVGAGIDMFFYLER